jgi:drug/metabolite transporter (DMT)-like permease
MTVAMALYVCIYRRYPTTPVAGPALVDAGILVPVGMLLGDPFTLQSSEILIIAVFAISFSIAAITLAKGAKLIPATDVALTSSLETPFALIWALMIFSEVLDLNTLVGGSIILLAVFGVQGYAALENRRYTIKRR